MKRAKQATRDARAWNDAHPVGSYVWLYATPPAVAIDAAAAVTVSAAFVPRGAEAAFVMLRRINDPAGTRARWRLDQVKPLALEARR